MADYPGPAYALLEIHERARAGFFHFRREALDGAAELDLDRQDIIDCILALRESDFHKVDGRGESEMGWVSTRCLQAHLLRNRLVREDPILAC